MHDQIDAGVCQGRISPFSHVLLPSSPPPLAPDRASYPRVVQGRVIAL